MICPSMCDFEYWVLETPPFTRGDRISGELRGDAVAREPIPPCRFRGPAVTEQLDRRADATRLQIVLAASHEFAHKSYSQVSLDDILAQAEVTKGAMYFHFRSKHELALAIIERQSAVARQVLDEVTARKLSALETLVDLSCAIVNRDLGDEVSRAGLNLLESIGRTDGVQGRLLNEWVRMVAGIVRRAVEEGDVVADRDPVNVARVLVS